MAIAELPITREYLPGWKTWEGLREVIQNALDEEVQNDHEAKVYYCEETSTVTVENQGSTLDPKAFLFGHTTKASDSRTIGQYGEGLKLGVLALVREGYDVRIAVGADAWQSRFLNSRKYGATILAFDIDKDVFPENTDVTVTVTGVSAAQYFAAIKRFLGIYHGGEIFVARKVLDRPLWKVIQVVCHEAMHLVGGDGTKAHFDSQAIVLSKIIASLWGEKIQEDEAEVVN